MADKKTKLLNDDSEEVTKEDLKALHRIFPELGRGGSISDEERNNAYVNIIKNRTKWKDDPDSEDDIRERSTNPIGRLGKRDSDGELVPAKRKGKPADFYDHPRSPKGKESD